MIDERVTAKLAELTAAADRIAEKRKALKKAASRAEHQRLENFLIREGTYEESCYFDLRRRLERIAKVLGCWDDIKREVEAQDRRADVRALMPCPRITPGTWAARFVDRASQRDEIVRYKDGTEFVISRHATKVWEVLRCLVESDDSGGYAELPVKWQGAFARTKDSEAVRDSGPMRLMAYIEPERTGRTGTRRYRLVADSKDTRKDALD